MRGGKNELTPEVIDMLANTNAPGMPMQGGRHRKSAGRRRTGRRKSAGRRRTGRRR